MDEMLNLRLELIEKSGEIDFSIRKAVIDFIKNIEKKYSIEVKEENGSMLVTHLAMALSRIKKGEEIESIDEEIFQEVKTMKIYSELPEYYKLLEEQLDIFIPQSEKDYIALHVCTLIKKTNN
ncbi:PRD domain-containing protein [Anaerosalibacter bizertensis]|uniref:PRD domain-containing protein n=1 Tax=Anaerosalibacter bizertensis TaxID=932217 RepID=A0A9Q4AD99_9FIRM|nr:PRD domain-containing protein [Anaerosalibacter bizertensis]MBV1819271.1 PRD domain-containing protein [Bacteroidales bacterium MSK.15.36]MCB5559805.1 PRD domain-containing protein [Anaerosalibacter bizertensis]MCG4565783.1 PRD domain-containing protein [Anaerosalibacter bizertensis]MCG4583021.1 PRD domain-containing protein [Anaerosalibacter bizertensis]MCG4583977.1 PRD domain-containing protein [Anaerosalibacter bizertensis]